MRAAICRPGVSAGTTKALRPLARTSPAETRPDGTVRASGLSAFVVPADTPGLQIAARIDVIAPHPLARLQFHDCRIAAEHARREAVVA